MCMVVGTSLRMHKISDDTSKQLDAHHETAVEQGMESVCVGSVIHFAGKVAA